MFSRLEFHTLIPSDALKTHVITNEELSSTEQLKRLGVTLHFGAVRDRHRANVNINCHHVSLECSTREVAFGYRTFFNQHRKDFCGEDSKFVRFIVDRYAKDLLKIGIAKPVTKKRKRKPKVKEAEMKDTEVTKVKEAEMK